jgi:hypothetical protein
VCEGIPDFRSPGGLWSKYDPRTYCDYRHFLEQYVFFLFLDEPTPVSCHQVNAMSEVACLSMPGFEQFLSQRNATTIGIQMEERNI